MGGFEFPVGTILLESKCLLFIHRSCIFCKERDNRRRPRIRLMFSMMIVRRNKRANVTIQQKGSRPVNLPKSFSVFQTHTTWVILLQFETQSLLESPPQITSGLSCTMLRASIQIRLFGWFASQTAGSNLFSAGSRATAHGWRWSRTTH